MNIGLIDVDGHNFPNLALMKISAYHKAIGDNVEWANPLFGDYDKVYKAKVFTFTEDNYDTYNCEVVKGGTGYDITSKLPKEIDDMQPDYSLYGIKDISYGFLTRGCPNRCKWCIVPIKEARKKRDEANNKYRSAITDFHILVYGDEEKFNGEPYRTE